MILLAGFQVLLNRYTGQSDIRVGVPIANRHRVETEGVVGFYGASSMERLPVEPAISGRVREFCELRIGRVGRSQAGAKK